MLLQQETIYQTKDNSFAFSAREVIGQYSMNNYHFHDQYEFYYLLSGKRYYFIKDRTSLVEKGNLVLIKPFDLHKTTDAGEGAHERVLINFDKKFLTPSIRSLLEEVYATKHNVIPLLPAEQEYIETMLLQFIQEIRNKEVGYESSLQALLMQLLIYLRRNKDDDSIIESNEHPSEMHKKMSEIVQYINLNYREYLSLSSVAKHFYISQYYLSRAFKQATGFTFVEYVNSVRIRESQILLRESDKKVIEIAEEVGFGNISHFGRVFKNITGYSPLHYKKMNKL
ncbi:AraC family transcriptional regulator [Natranaerovirga pectinivora]|uniref:AraC family transcriptional regulator n=1 Tax=Natranaerovirga pectinivora TaxID=682400 RepID=A0A4R3MQ50_9FIRM|nr:helix-turn-helix domain-containing protein [Natranaerovirga pectinivora]TCT16992.1 AraC family transcriptional regulator [Natranaerovirga pectinivora]